MEEQGEQREIWASAPQGDKGVRRRRPVIATSVSALVAAVVCGGGLALANRGDDPGPTEATAAVSPLPIPMIVSAEELAADPQDLPGSVTKATARLAEAVRAGEEVYTAARPTASSRVLERLRTALDEASAVLDDEPDRDATAKQLASRLRTLNGLRTKILDAAARITAVRTVPGAELPPGTMTAAIAPDGTVVPYDETGDAGTEGPADGDTVRAEGGDGAGSGSGTGSGGSSGSGSGDSGSGDSGDSGDSGGTGDGDSGGTAPAPLPTRRPTPSSAPSSPSPVPTPSPSPTW